jgi:hypothetical protein
VYAAGLNVVVNTLYVICGDPEWQHGSAQGQDIEVLHDSTRAS